MSQHLQYMLGSMGTFLVGFIASPTLEFLKSSLLAKSVQKERRRELITKLRMALGYMDAFRHHLHRAAPDGPSSTGVDSGAWQEVQAFSLKAMRQFTGDLTRLDLEISTTSGIGQSLVTRMLLFFSAAEQVKKLELVKRQVYEGTTAITTAAEKPHLRFVEKLAFPEEANSVFSQFEECDLWLRRFIAGPYAQKLRIGSLSLVFDPDIAAWDRVMREEDIRKASEQLRDKINKLKS